MSYHAEKTRELTPLEFILPRTISVQRTTPPGDELEMDRIRAIDANRDAAGLPALGRP